MKILFSILIALLCTSLSSQKEISKIDSILDSKIEDSDPGFMLGIVKEGKIIYEKYRGLANLSHNVNVSEKTRSNIASTAKQFTALMILDLSMKGKISLEDDLRKYLPSFYPKVEHEIKIRHIINHTSGIRDYVELMSLKNKIWWKQVGLDNDDVIELLEKQEELAFVPGSKYTYSNSGYVLLAKIIEEVTGVSFVNYSSNFFKDLGMNETSFVERYMGVIPNKAEPYADWGGGVWFQSPTVTKTQGEGFLFTSLKDQLIYEQTLQNAKLNNNKLLQESQQAIPQGEINTYGFGLELENRLGRKAVHHAGATYGYQSQTLRFPDEKLSIFIMSNNGNIRTDLIVEEIASIYLPVVRQKENYDKELFAVTNKSDDLEIFGQYTYPDGGQVIQIVSEEGKTFYKEGNYKLEMLPDSANTFSFAYDPSLKAVFYKDKMVEYYSSGKTMVYTRNTSQSASFSDIEGLLGSYYNKELEVTIELDLSPENKVKLSFQNGKKGQTIEVLNKFDLYSRNYRMKVERDQFNRVTDILLTLGRAENIRFKKKTNLQFQPKIATDNGSIQVTTIGSTNGKSSDILLTKNYPNGNEIWFKQFGGSSYDKASSILATKDGYLIIGSTSSYGNGNYDMFVIKTDKEGKKIWQNTYGGLYNEYGYSAEKIDEGYVIKGSIQNCTSNSDVFNRTCSTNVWFVSIDESGKEISSEVLEEIQ